MKRYILSAACLAALLMSQSARAATITVNTNADPDVSTPDTCSLRQAIQSANTDGTLGPIGNCTTGDVGLDEINFANPNDTYSLTINPTYTDNTEGDLDICSNLTINGGGIGVTVIRAAFTVGNDRVMQIHNSTNNPFGCFETPNGAGQGGGNPSPVVTLNGVTISDGQAEDTFNGVFGGGGILNAGALTINDSEISFNTADNTNNSDENAYGGGILHLNTTVINRSLIHDNTARSVSFANDFYAAGGGIATNSADVNCLDPDCLLEINDTSIFNNTVDNGAGGGIAHVAFGSEDLSVFVLRSAIYDNDVIGSLGDPTGLSTFGNGGGISRLLDNLDDPAFFLLVDSTVSGNTAVKNGGGFHEVSGDLTNAQILSSTIANNTASQDGGGIHIDRSSQAGGTIQMLNTILADNSAPLGPDCSSTDPAEALTSEGFNLIFDVTGCTLDGPMTGDVPPGNDPLLGTLQINGGLTPTHALSFGSPAIDTARAEADGGCVDNLVGGAPLLFDQRNDPFDRVVAGVIGGTPRCDIGAFEFQPSDIDAEKDVSSGAVEVGEAFTYTITVTNNGPGTVTGVTIVDDLPDIVTFASFGTISQGTCNQAAGVVTCDIGTLAPGASASVEINVIANAAGTADNEATVTTNETDPDNPDTTNIVTTTIGGGGNLILEGSGILSCGLQGGEATGNSPWALVAILALTFVVLGTRRFSRGH